MKKQVKLFYKNLKTEVFYHKFCFIFTITSWLLIASFFVSYNQKAIYANKVLGEKKTSTQNSSVSQKPSPSPELERKTPSLPNTVKVSSKIPTPTPTATQSPVATITVSTPTPSPMPYPTPTPTPNPTPTPTLVTPMPEASASATPNPQENLLSIVVTIDYQNLSSKPKDVYSIKVEPAKNAWDALKEAVGEENIQFKDYRGDLGIYIIGINGVVPTGNQYWQFSVNGKVSDVGVSSYVLNHQDQIEFKVVQWPGN